jgi:hypothetical protein
MFKEFDMSKNWVPEILYEDSEDGGLSSHIPFIQVPDGEVMPRFLFICESRDTGETEMGAFGEEQPIVELELYQYANMNTLKENLSLAVYDQVRAALGLEPMAIAVEKGKKITERVRQNIES